MQSLIASRIESFSGRLQGTQTRLEELCRQVEDSPEGQSKVVRRVLSELQSAWEELLVSEEELRAQNDELAAASLSLETERRRYMELFDFAPVAYLVTDEHGVIREANQAAMAMMGFAAPMTAGRLLVSCIPFEEHSRFRTELSRVKQLGVHEWEGLMQCKDEAIDVSFKAVVIPRQDRSSQLLWLLRDITQRKRNEKEIEQLNRQLEERVRARTADLEDANRQNSVLLESEQAARKTAESAGLYKDEFIATVSHELRTPLNVILGWCTMLRSADPEEPKMLRQGIEAIERSSRLQAHLVNDLLDMSRINAGKLRLDLTPVDLNAVIESSVETVRGSAASRTQELLLTLDSESVLVDGDSARLQQVLINLISNAIQFTPMGGHIEVRLVNECGYAWITVADNGKGIEPEFLPFVFDRFRQADSSITRRHSGLGLGLAIARHLVELHDGTIHIESPGAGKGTTVTVLLPLRGSQETVSEQAVEASPDPASAPARSLLRGLRVLVVEDEDDSRQVIAGVLRFYGAETRTASSAQEGLDIAREWRPSIVVSDIAMPEEDGYSFIKRLRADTSLDGGSIPAVALTALVRPEDRQQALDAGFQAHFAKPIDANELIRAMHRLATGAGGGEAL